MIQYLYNNNYIIYAFAVLCGIGLLLRLIVNSVYKHMIKESDRLGETKNRMLQFMKMKFSTCYKLKIGVNNVDTFVDKNVLRYRFCGVLLSTWDNLCGQVLYLILLAVPILAVFGVAAGCGQDQVLITGAVGILASAVLILVDKSINLVEKKKIMRLNLLDYLENFCKVRMEQEALNPDLVEQYRREYFGAMGKKLGMTVSDEQAKEGTKQELNRRREARMKKQEEKRLQAVKREEDQRRAEEARKEAEIRKLEEKRLLAARRREEERLKMEEEREALEARRTELLRKTENKNIISDNKLKKVDDKEEILHSLEDELKPSLAKTGMEELIKGVEEIAAEKEQAILERVDKVQVARDKVEKKAKPPVKSAKVKALELQEEKLIEDVLKEFFA